MKTYKINQKPISLDLHLKYRCPNDSCGIDHWLSLNETKTKHFKIVCDCGSVFKPKQISKIKVLYKATKKTVQKTDKLETKEEQKTNKETEKVIIPKEILEKASQILSIYGFTNQESVEMISETYSTTQEQNIAELVKYTLSSFGRKNV